MAISFCSGNRWYQMQDTLRVRPRDINTIHARPKHLCWLTVACTSLAMTCILYIHDRLDPRGQRYALVALQCIAICLHNLSGLTGVWVSGRFGSSADELRMVCSSLQSCNRTPLNRHRGHAGVDNTVSTSAFAARESAGAGAGAAVIGTSQVSVHGVGPDPRLVPLLIFPTVYLAAVSPSTGLSSTRHLWV